MSHKEVVLGTALHAVAGEASGERVRHAEVCFDELVAQTTVPRAVVLEECRA